ncbi:MAG: glycosyltransferase [Planctomycetota bacterium]|nr:glycosyltransferase [Planctomycetota bacterium]
MISFIVPAYNEEAVLGATLDTLFSSARALNEPFEVLVVNDASADHTADIARARGARVVDVQCRQIAAVRNAGAREAKGDLFVFLDADTLLPEATLRDALRAVREGGAVGGGGHVRFDARTPWRARVLAAAFTFVWFGLRWAAGCFIFVRREAFEAVGGFDERYYISEELHLSRALKRHGRFVILKSSVITSGRKLRMVSLGAHLRLVARLLLQGPKSIRRREGLGLWYDGRRESP